MKLKTVVTDGDPHQIMCHAVAIDSQCLEDHLWDSLGQNPSVFSFYCVSLALFPDIARICNAIRTHEMRLYERN